MTKTVTQANSMLNAYESNPYKQLVLIGIHTGEGIGIMKGAIPEYDEIGNPVNKQVIDQMRRTHYLSIYTGMDRNPTNIPNAELNAGKIKAWINGVPRIDGEVRVIAYSAKNNTTLSDVYWADAPLNNTGGMYGFDANNPESDYKIPEHLPPKLCLDEDPFMDELDKDYLAENARTVRWTDDTIPCKVANTLISLSSKLKLLDIDKILIKL